MVVSQVYGGGGNSGATYANDFVELFNRGATAVDLGTWSIQYASATGTSWQVTPLTGSVQPGKYFLVQLASAAAVGGRAADAGRDRNDEPGERGREGGRRPQHDRAHVRSLRRELLGGSERRRPRRLRLGDGLRRFRRRARPGEHDRRRPRRCAGAPTPTRTTATSTGATPAPRNSAAAAATCAGGPPPEESGSASAGVEIDIEGALSISLEKQNISFGSALAGESPAAVSERVTVSSTNAAGYALTVHRSAFQPVDLPLGMTATAPSSGQIGPQLAGGAKAAIPIAPAPDLLIGTTSARSGTGGDAWPTNVSFVSALPAVPPGHYTATVTYTVVGR